MPKHKFKLGQSVRYLPDKQARADTLYKIMRLLPAVGRDQQYRIKCASEPYERSALESQLAPATGH